MNWVQGLQSCDWRMGYSSIMNRFSECSPKCRDICHQDKTRTSHIIQCVTCFSNKDSKKMLSHSVPAVTDLSHLPITLPSTLHPHLYPLPSLSAPSLTFFPFSVSLFSLPHFQALRLFASPASPPGKLRQSTLATSQRQECGEKGKYWLQDVRENSGGHWAMCLLMDMLNDTWKRGSWVSGCSQRPLCVPSFQNDPQTSTHSQPHVCIYLSVHLNPLVFQGKVRPQAETDCVQHLSNQLRRHRRHRHITNSQQHRAALRRIRQLQQTVRCSLCISGFI